MATLGREDLPVQERVKRTLIAIGLWLVSLVALIASLGLGDLGGPPWLIVLLLGWLVTLGAPSTIGVLAVVKLWPGGSFLWFIGLASVVALLAQLVAVWTSSKLLLRKRQR